MLTLEKCPICNTIIKHHGSEIVPFSGNVMIDKKLQFKKFKGIGYICQKCGIFYVTKNSKVFWEGTSKVLFLIPQKRVKFTFREINSSTFSSTNSSTESSTTSDTCSRIRDTTDS